MSVQFSARLKIVLPDDTAMHLVEVADSSGSTAADLVREAISEGLKRRWKIAACDHGSRCVCRASSHRAGRALQTRHIKVRMTSEMAGAVRQAAEAADTEVSHAIRTWVERSIQ